MNFDHETGITIRDFIDTEEYYQGISDEKQRILKIIANEKEYHEAIKKKANIESTRYIVSKFIVEILDGITEQIER